MPKVLRRTADVLLIVFVVLLAVATMAQVNHNIAIGPHHGPHDRPVAPRTR